MKIVDSWQALENIFLDTYYSLKEGKCTIDSIIKTYTEYSGILSKDPITPDRILSTIETAHRMYLEEKFIDENIVGKNFKVKKKRENTVHILGKLKKGDCSYPFSPTFKLTSMDYFKINNVKNMNEVNIQHFEDYNVVYEKPYQWVEEVGEYRLLDNATEVSDFYIEELKERINETKNFIGDN